VPFGKKKHPEVKNNATEEYCEVLAMPKQPTPKPNARVGHVDLINL
jgi:hypothetical protein